MANSYQHRLETVEARLRAGRCGDRPCVKCVIAALGRDDGVTARDLCDGDPRGLTALLMEMERDDLPHTA